VYSVQVVIPPRPRPSATAVKKPESASFAVEIPVRRAAGRTMEADARNLPYEVLDLTLHGLEATCLCRNTMKLLANAKRIVVVAGAGISVAAGIPDFRSSAGLFSTLKADTKYKPSGKELFDVSVYKVLVS
jgi:hypothetical protein